MKLFTITTLSALIISLTATLKITQSFTTDEGLPSNEIRTIFNDPTGSLWIGSGGGAAKLVDAQWKIDEREINPVINGVSTILKDSKSKFWFGGLHECHVYENDSYKTYSISEDLGVNGRLVFSFHEDENQNIWAATTGGAAIFNGTNWQPFTMENGLKHNVIHDIEQSENGDFWFATRKGGLNIYDGKNWQYLYPEKNCRKILKDNSDNMWVGTSDGIIKFDGKEWQVFEGGNTILPMFVGQKGFIWCIANGIDIIRISPGGKSIYYENPTNNQANEIYHLEYSEDGSVWAGTDQGVFVFH